MLLGIRWKSIRLKIIAWSFVPTAIILMAVALVNFSAYQQVTQTLVIERDRELTRLAASQLTSEVDEYANILLGLARTPDIYSDNPLSQQTVIKQASNGLVVFDGGVLLLNTFGRVIAAEPSRPDILGYDWSDRDYFQQILHSSEPVYSNIVSDGWQGQPVIAITVPIIDNQSKFRGAIVGLFRLGQITISPFYGSIVKLRLGESGSTYLIDNKGYLIYHSDVYRIGEDISNQSEVQQVLGGHGGAIRTKNIDGRDIVAGFAPVPGTPWGLITEDSWDVLYQSSQGYRRILLFLLLLGIIIPILVVVAGVNRLTKPIEALIIAAQTVAGGKFDWQIVVNTGDELEELADQFNIMSARLRESYANLEQRVVDRTQEVYVQAQKLAAAEERQRLARDLHDSVTQSLYSVTLYAEATNRLLAAGQIERAAEHVVDMRQTAQEALAEVRLLIFELRPPVLEQEGLVAALRTRLEAVERRAGLKTIFHIASDIQDNNFPLEFSTGLYWIAQESLNNILKHARATQVTLSLFLTEEGRKLELHIMDNGHGFNPADIIPKGRLGVQGMQERAALLHGEITIDSQPGVGTKISIKVPYHEKTDNNIDC